MSEEEHQHLPGTKPVSGYQEMGVNVRAMAWFVVGFALSVAAIVIGLWWLEKPFIRGDFSEDRSPRALDVEQPLQPSPGHPAMPWDDLEAMRHDQETRLNNFGPLAGDPSHVHIPIDRAMEMLLQSGDLTKSWSPPATLPFKMETQPSPYVKPTVRNRT